MAAQPGIVLRVLSLVLPLAAISAAASPALAREPAPPDARVRIIWPSDGQMIKGGKFWLRMGTSNVGVAPAGVQKPKTGHHHLLVDVADLPPLDQPIPNNSGSYRVSGWSAEG